MLLGGLSAGALVAAAPAAETRISPESVYLNDYFVPGAGYYHAPFQAFVFNPDGTPWNYRIVDPRRFILSATFDL